MLDDVGGRVDDARDHVLALRKLDVLPHPPLVGVPPVGGHEHHPIRLCVQEDVDDVLEGDVVLPRHLPVSPADVDPHRLRRDVGDCVVERLDPERDLAAKLVDRRPHDGKSQVRAVELEEDARTVDRLVLLPHLRCDRLQVGLVARVVAVRKEHRDHPGRGGAHEEALRLRLAGRRLEVLDVLLDCGEVLVRDGAVACGELEGERILGAGRHLRREVRELREVGPGRHQLGDRALAPESAQTVLDVGGVAGLALLTVVEDVDPGIGLLLHDLLHCRAHLAIELGGVDRLAGFLRVNQGEELGRAWQAPRVCREDPIRASLHDSLLSFRSGRPDPARR